MTILSPERPALFRNSLKRRKEMFYALAKKTATLFVMLGTTWLLIPSTSSAQSFEGEINQRTITLHEDALRELAFALEEENSEFEEMSEGWGDDEYDANYAHWLAQQILAIPPEELLARSSEAELLSGTLYISGQKIRAEVQDDETPFDYFLMDTKAGTIFMVSEAQRFYVKWSADEMRAMAGMGMESGAGESGEGLEVQALGKTETINGVQCTAYGVESDADFTVAWVSSGHSGLSEAFKAFSERMEGMFGEEVVSGSSAKDLLWEKGLPVRTQTLYRNPYAGLSTYEIEDMLSVEQKSLSSDLFEVPAGYAEKSLQELWRQD
jgi:hypothetical protein